LFIDRRQSTWMHGFPFWFKESAAPSCMQDVVDACGYG
jgi:hypothetical protein